MCVSNFRQEIIFLKEGVSENSHSTSLQFLLETRCLVQASYTTAILILSIKSPPSRFFAYQIKGDASLSTVSIGTIVYFRFSEFIRLSLRLRFRFAAACLPFFVIKSENNGSTMDFERCAKALTKRTVLSHDCFLSSRTQVCAQINLIYLTLYMCIILYKTENFCV